MPSSNPLAAASGAKCDQAILVGEEGQKSRVVPIHDRRDIGGFGQP